MAGDVLEMIKAKIDFAALIQYSELTEMCLLERLERILLEELRHPAFKLGFYPACVNAPLRKCCVVVDRSRTGIDEATALLCRLFIPN